MSTKAPAINTHGIWAIYRFEMARALRTLWQSLVTPVITTSLYFVVFGGALGIAYRDLETSKSSLEDIFVGLVEAEEAA